MKQFKQLILEETRELQLSLNIGINAKTIEEAEKKSLRCKLNIVDIEGSAPYFEGLSSCTLNNRLLKKYNITGENVDSIDIDLYAIVQKEFLKVTKKLSLYLMLRYLGLLT